MDSLDISANGNLIQASVVSNGIGMYSSTFGTEASKDLSLFVTLQLAIQVWKTFTEAEFQVVALLHLGPYQKARNSVRGKFTQVMLCFRLFLVV